MKIHFGLISADSHVVTEPNAFLDRMSKSKFGDRIPHLECLALDMQNQLMQVKTQVAIAIADQHVLEKETERKLGQRS